MDRDFRLKSDRQTFVWQLISININRQRTLDISIIKKRKRKRLESTQVCMLIVIILSIQDGKSLDVSNLELTGNELYEDKSELSKLLFPISFT